MVNASLNWASIVGIVLAVCGGGLYFLRSFKPALARDYDVFFAAIGLLCGGILFFQGWRLDPILQFGQFLLAGTTVFFAYESVRLRGVATDQARRSSFFEDDQVPNTPRGSSRSRWDEYDQFQESDRPSRRFRGQDDEPQDNYSDERFSRRSLSRAIPEAAVSRRRSSLRDSKEFQNDDSSRQRIRSDDRSERDSRRNNFGERRTSRTEVKRGSRPLANQNLSRKSENDPQNVSSSKDIRRARTSPLRNQISKDNVEEASFSQKKNEIKKPRQARRSAETGKSTSKNSTSRYTVGSKKTKPRDNSSRFDD